MNPYTLGDAYAVASAIYAGTDVSIVDTEVLGERLYDTIDATEFGSEDAKADLYAQLAERLTHKTNFADAVDIIALSMQRTRHRFGGH